MTDHPPYPSGLRLSGRRVLVVGGGQVAQRRIPGLLAAGADVVVVSPQVTPAIEGQVLAGEVAWLERGFADEDLDDTWYVIAATDDPSRQRAGVQGVPRQPGSSAYAPTTPPRRRAWTPAVGRYDGLTLAVLGRREPRRTAAVRDAIVTGLHEGTIAASERRPSVPGVTLVGGGPGDPELISVAGRRALMEADVVVADRLAPRELLGDLPATTEVVDVAKLPRGRSARQEEINRLIVERALGGAAGGPVQGRRQLRVRPRLRGDRGVPRGRRTGARDPRPLQPARRSGRWRASRSPIARSRTSSRWSPATCRPGHAESLVDWEAVGRLRGTLLLMMAVENAPHIATALLTAGRPATTPVAVVCDGSMPGERTVLSTLGELGADLDRHAVRPPAIIVVGDVVAVAHPQHFSAWQS